MQDNVCFNWLAGWKSSRMRTRHLKTMYVSFSFNASYMILVAFLFHARCMPLVVFELPHMCDSTSLHTFKSNFAIAKSIRTNTS